MVILHIVLDYGLADREEVFSVSACSDHPLGLARRSQGHELGSPSAPGGAWADPVSCPPHSALCWLDKHEFR